MKRFFILAAVGLVCISCGNGRPKSKRECGKEEKLLTPAVNQMSESVQELCSRDNDDSSREWSEDILTVENCLRTRGKPKETIRHGDTLTLVYGHEHECISMIYVRDTLACEIID